MNYTLEEFLDLLENKSNNNPDELLDHSSWESCAFGKYVLSKDTEADTFTISEIASEIVPHDKNCPFGSVSSPYALLNYAVTIEGINDTYGNLKKSLESRIENFRKY